MIKIPLENPYTWVITLSLVKSVTNTFIWWGEKTKTSKEIVTCGNSVSLSSCCEQAAAGMLRALPFHFGQLQSNSTQRNMHDSCAATKNCRKCGISCEIDCWGNYWNGDILSTSTWNLHSLHHYMHDSHAVPEKCMICGISYETHSGQIPVYLGFQINETFHADGDYF